MAELLVASPEFVFDIAAGSVGGFCSKALDYPFDTAKVLLQTQTKDATVQYKGTFDCLQQAIQQKGFISLYSGIGSRLLGSMAENAVCFLAYAGIKRTLQQQQQHGHKLSELSVVSLAGAGSGAVVSFVMTPVELIKCRMQVSSQLPTPLYKGSIDCMIQTVRKDGGLRALYRGHTSTMCREVPGNLFWYLTYEVCCNALTPIVGATSRDDLPVRAHMAAGAAAGVAYWAAIFPVDTVKSVLQTSSTSSQAADGALIQRPPTFAQAGRTLYQQQGMRGLYRGFGVTALRAAPANAVLFAAYEQTVTFLKNL